MSILSADHFNGKTLKRLADERATLRFGCCEWLVKPLVDSGVSKERIDVYEIGKVYDYKAFKISPIQLYHGDCPQCGYRIFVGNEKALYATDTSTMRGITAKDYSLYLIESNYTEDDLEQRIIEKTAAGQYCYELYVAERHLSHTQASEWLLQNMGQKSEYVFLHQHKSKDKPKGWEYADK